MRKLLTLALALGFCSQAGAAKPYAEETCRAQLRRGQVDFYADTSESGFVVRGSNRDLELDALYVRKHPTKRNAPQGNEDLVLEVINDTKVGKQKYADGCFSGEVIALKRKISVAHASQAAHDILGLRDGQTLTLNCRVERVQASDSCSASAQPLDRRE